MILDERNEFADALALSTAATGLALIGDVIDLGTDGAQGNSDNLYLVIQIDTAVTSAGAATLGFRLVSDAAAAIATDGSATEHIVITPIAKATLVAGYQVCAVELPRGTYERYLGILQDVGVAALTAGKFNAFLTNDPYAHNAFPNAVGA